MTHPTKSYLFTYRMPMNILFEADGVIVETSVRGDYLLAKTSELHGE